MHFTIHICQVLHYRYSHNMKSLRCWICLYNLWNVNMVLTKMSMQLQDVDTYFRV